MTMYGADALQLEQLAASLSRAAGELETIQRNLGARVRTVGWPGRDGDRFRQQWHGSLGPTLLHTLAQLEEASSRLLRNAEDQRRASGALAGGADAVPSGTGSGGAGSGVPWLPGLPPIIGVPGFPGLPWLPGLPGGPSLDDLVALVPTLAGVARYTLDAADSLWPIVEGIEQLTGLDDLAGLRSWDSASSAFGIMSGVSWFAGQFAPKGSGARLLTDGAGYAFELGGSIAYLAAGAPALTGVVSRIGPGIGIVSGGVGLAVDVADMVENGVTWDNGLGAASNGLMMAGSVAMLVPGGQVVGGALILTGTAIEAGTWVYENWDEIEGYLGDGAELVAEWGMTGLDAATDLAGDAFEAAGQALDTAGDVVADVGTMVDSGLDAIGDGFGAIGEGLGGLFG